MSKSVIGLLGPAGAGKTTAAAYLERAYGAKRYSFARPLKEMCRIAFGLSEAQLYGTQAEKEAIDPRYGVSGRQILQGVGTDGIGADAPPIDDPSAEAAIVRAAWAAAARSVGFGALSNDEIIDAYTRGFRVALGPLVWIRLTMNAIVRDAPEIAVIEDVRFRNEAEQIRTWEYPAPRRARGFVWRLWPVGASTSTDPGTHASETEWIAMRPGVVTQEIAPPVRGVDLLETAIRQAAELCGIRPAGAL